MKKSKERIRKGGDGKRYKSGAEKKKLWQHDGIIKAARSCKSIESFASSGISIGISNTSSTSTCSCISETTETPKQTNNVNVISPLYDS